MAERTGRAARAAAARGRLGSAGWAVACWTALAVVCSVLPLSRLITPTWLLPSVVVVAIIAAAGQLVRRTRHPAGAPLVELVAWVLCITPLLPAGVPRLVVFPLPGTFAAIGPLLSSAADQIADGIAPVEPLSQLQWTLIAAAGLLVIAIDYVVLTARLPMLASIGLVAVAVLPALIVPQWVEAVFYVPLAVVLLLLLHADARQRSSAASAAGARPSPAASVVAAAVGAVSVLAAMIAPAVLPTPTGNPDLGLGATTTIDADLDLGRDLRQPSPTEVLRLATSDGSAPYLRVATLTDFDGEVWTPDSGSLSSLTAGIPDPEQEPVEMTDRTAGIEITGLSGEYLPVPYSLTGIDGVASGWAMLAANRTVLSAGTSSLGAEYRVDWQVAAPSAEQAQAAAAGAGSDQEAATELPDDVPAIIPQTAREVTDGATNAYDTLVDLQNWFRSSGEFTYSLDTPVEDDFDGSGMDAIATFLEVRAGYCVHFASAFAVMARELGIPTRVVVGYLPGSATGETDDDDRTVYSYTSSQLHAWPESYLDGIGWVAFEPTASLGSPTRFSEESQGDDGATPTPTPTTSAGTSSASPAATIDPGRQDGVPEATGTTGEGVRLAEVLRVVAIAVGVLIVLALPLLVRLGRRILRLRSRGSARPHAMWRELVDIAIDAGVDVEAHESPRALGARLIAERNAPRHDVEPIVDSIERSSYARPDPARAASAPALQTSRDDPARRRDRSQNRHSRQHAGFSRPETAADAAALNRIRDALLPRRADRLRAAFLPRSLVVRPRLARRP